MVRVPRIAPAVMLEHALCLACLLVLPLVVLRPAIFNGQFPLDTDSIYYAIPWEEARPDHLPPEDPGGPRDIVERYYPDFVFLNDAALAGESVQWNSGRGYGVPFVAQWRTRALSPFSIPYYFFELRAAMAISLFAKLAIAGLSAFFIARLFWLRPASALLIAIAYQLSPVFLLTWNSPMADTVPWFPLLLIMFERFGGGRTRVWPACATIFALMFLGGDPESVVATLLMGGIFVLARSILGGRGVRLALTPLAVLMISALAGAAMTSIQLFPFVEWLRYAESTIAPANVHQLHIADLVMSILPHWYGAPAISSVGGPEAQRTLVAGFLFLSAPLCFAFPYWFALRKEIAPGRTAFPDTLFVAVIASIVLGLITGIAGTINIGFLYFTPAHFWFPLSFYAATLLARSGEEWSHLMPDPCQDALKRFVLFAPAILAVWILVIAISGPNDAGVSRLGQAVLLSVLTTAFVTAVAVTVLKPNPTAFAYACAAMIACPLLYAFGSAQPFRAPEDVFPETDIVKAFEGIEGRVGGGEVAAHWPLTGNRIPYAAVSDGHALRRQRVFESALKKDPALLARTGLQRLALRDVDLESTYAAIRDQMRIARSFSAGAFWVELMNPVPRARLIYANVPIPMFTDAPVSSNTPPVVEGGPVLLESAPSQGDWAGVYATIDNPNVFDVDAAAPAVLVVTEAWYPGWRAYVDDTETVVTPVDAIFRGVPVSPGAHRVEMFFDPQSYRIGKGVSVLATLVVLLAFAGRISTIMRKRRRLR